MSKKREEKIFDKEDVLDNELKPLMEKIFDICKRNGMPFIFDIVFFNDSNRAKSCTSQYCPDDQTPPGSHLILHLIRTNREQEAVLILMAEATNQTSDDE